MNCNAMAHRKALSLALSAPLLLLAALTGCDSAGPPADAGEPPLEGAAIGAPFELTGETGDTAVPFKAANTVAHGNTGFTKNKLLAVREKMNLNDVDIEAEMPVMLLDPQSETELLGIQEYVNTDYNPGHTLSRGEIKPWLGFRFVRTNLTSTRAYKNGAPLVAPEANAVALPVFVPSGLHRGIWTEFFGDIGTRRDKKMSEQVYAEACSAVVRVNEDKCYQVVVKHA